MKLMQTAAIVAVLAAAPTMIWAAPETYKIDPVHSFVMFKIRHMNAGNVYGQFKDFKGTIVADKEDPAKSNFDIEIDTNSVDTKNSKRDEHVMGPDFLNSKQFPTMSFKSDSIKKVSDNEFEATGKITLHGVTKPLTTKIINLGEATDKKGTTRMGAETTFTVKRSEFGINAMPGAAGEDVTVTVAIEAIKESAEKPAE